MTANRAEKGGGGMTLAERLRELAKRLGDIGHGIAVTSDLEALADEVEGKVLVPLDTFNALLGTAEEYVRAEANWGNDAPIAEAAIEVALSLLKP